MSTNKVSIHGILPVPTHPVKPQYINEIKQKLLLFDSIGVSHPTDLLRELDIQKEKKSIDELSRLLDEGEVFNSLDLTLIDQDDNVILDEKIIRKHIRENNKEYFSKNPDMSKEFKIITEMAYAIRTKKKEITFEMYAELQSRALSILWNAGSYDLKTEEFFPLSALHNIPEFDRPKVEVYNVMFKNIPILHPDTPIEHILEFKNNPENHGRLLQFRSFVNRLSKEGLSEIELTQEIEHMMYQYKQAMSYHKIESLSGLLNVSLGFVINAGYTVMEALGALINININNVNLAKSEMSAPGREISYLYKTNQMFGKQ